MRKLFTIIFIMYRIVFHRLLALDLYYKLVHFAFYENLLLSFILLGKKHVIQGHILSEFPMIYHEYIPLFKQIFLIYMKLKCYTYVCVCGWGRGMGRFHIVTFFRSKINQLYNLIMSSSRS